MRFIGSSGAAVVCAVLSVHCSGSRAVVKSQVPAAAAPAKLQLGSLDAPFVTKDGTVYVAEYLDVDSSTVTKIVGPLIEEVLRTGALKFMADSEPGVADGEPTFIEHTPETAAYPTWVVAGSGLFVTAEHRRILLGVGASRGVKNRKLALTIARNRARTELVKMMEIAVASKKRDFHQSMATGDMDVTPEIVEQAMKTYASSGPSIVALPDTSRENYARTNDTAFSHVAAEPLSTFSIDVDTAAYANVRRFLRAGQMPPKDAVRIEELINYFDYRDPLPDEELPFSVNVELAPAPWAPKHRLVRIGLKSKPLSARERRAANLVFLIDVSGSMASPKKLPLLRRALRLLVQNLNPDDRVAIVVYAGASGLVLPSTPVAKSETIMAALERLHAGGSTNGGAGIELAYAVAQQNFVAEGVNRVVLATDGDFNVGTTTQAELERLIEAKAKGGVFLTVLGLGSGNLNDATLEAIADHGNGNYGYVDSLREAKKLLVEQIDATLVTVAKDVKLQVEFNPERVGAYRLIGYDNRRLRAEEFDDDAKDAGELGAGHTVTALYEVVPPAQMKFLPKTPKLKYRRPSSVRSNHPELMTVKVRYKAPKASKSRRFEVPVIDPGPRRSKPSANFRFAAAVAGFGMLLRDEPHRGSLAYASVVELARPGLADDPHGYRKDFVRLVKKAQALSAAD